jgi:hypothetical protein
MTGPASQQAGGSIVGPGNGPNAGPGVWNCVPKCTAIPTALGARQGKTEVVSPGGATPPPGDQWGRSPGAYNVSHD